MNRFSSSTSSTRPLRSRLSRLVVLVLAAGGVAALAVPARAAGPALVTLEFDNTSISLYNLAYQQALQPHNARATFFVTSGSVGASSLQMSWAQLGTLAASGNDIGGKTVNATNLTTDPNPTAQVCNDRAAILSHGLTPVGFAYPGGANNATVQAVVKGCGYGNARSITSGTESLPPANWFATKANAPGQVTLATMQTAVNNASVNGGWVQLVMSRVCSQTLDANNYATCSAASGRVELADLNAFLDWMANAGQPGGAPAGATLSKLSTVVGSVDSSAPVTTISCNGAPCAGTPYSDVVSVTLAATDTGTGVASTHYTVDGSDPTLASPTYSGAFNVNGASSSTTVKYRSWDYQGNAEATQTQVVLAPSDADAPTTTIACDAAACSGTPYVASVTVTLSASDTGGSGVAATYYTTDGSTPTTASASYSGPFQLNTPGTYDVRYFSTDNAGNAEQVKSQQVTVVPVTTTVSLTFDNGTVGQYTLGYLQALKPHGAKATYYINSGNVGASAAIMTWAQLSALAAEGNDIGGKTVNATNLTTDPDPVAQVCDDRATLRQHGLDPVGFAYPGGAFNASIKDIVRTCGYGFARSAGSVSPSGPTYAETLPPKDWFATRAYAPGGQVSLANLKALVNGAASHGGGWVQAVLTRVCSQASDPAGYAACTTGSGWVELADLDAFLDWMDAAGQGGGAPAGARLATVREAATGADAVAPVTVATCNDTACSPGTYTSVVRVAMSATDAGSAVAGIHYTTDGSTPTQASPLYTGRIAVMTTTTLKYRAWDNVGNAEPVNTLVITTDLAPDGSAPSTTINCDGSPCTIGAYNGSTKVTFIAEDGAGWGVDATYYTTDGSTPTTSSPVYSGPFNLTPGTFTVRFFSVDFAGNAEPPQSQQIVVDAPDVVVSFTFDDGDANQFSLAFQRALKPHGMHGTFYINTGNLGSGPGFMTWADVEALAQAGEDVGGHTLHHIDLTSSGYSQQQKVDEVCQDRQALIQHGIASTSFAYPFGAYDANAKAIVETCGYSDARRTGGIALSGAPYTETIPPRDPYATITWTAPTPTSSPIELSDMKNAVIAASEHGGGWVQFVAHEVCSQTYDPSNYQTCLGSFRPIELDTLKAFMDWLQTSGQPGGAPASTTVKTVAEVVVGHNPPVLDTAAPTTTIACDGAPCAGWYQSAPQVTLSAEDNAGGSGLDATYYTTDGTTPTTSSTRYTGPFAVSSTSTVRYFSLDQAGNAETAKSKLVQVDGTAPSTSIACNGLVCSTAWYASAVQVTLPGSDGSGGSGVAATYYTTDGSTPTTSSALYTASFSVSQTRTVRYFSIDTAGNAETVQSQLVQVDDAAPTTSIACGGATCSTGWYTAAVQVTLTGADGAGGSGVAATYYTTNGTTPTTSSTLYVGAFGLAQTATVRWLSVDTAGNAETPGSQLVQIDTAAPSTSITCNSATCSTGWYTAAVTVRLPASDVGGSGLAATYYTTDGSTPTTSSTRYTGSFTVSQATTIRYFSVDTAGNTEAVKSQLVRVDSAAPTTTITCNNAGCVGSTYTGAVTVRLSASDGTGSGVASTHYTTNGTTPTLNSPTYTGPFTVSAATTTVRFRSWDAAGNVEAVKSQTIKVTLDAPPVARLSVTPTSGSGPLTVIADASASTDTDATPIASYTFSWGDGTAAVSGASSQASHTYTKTGTYTLTLTVRDTAGLTGSVTKKIQVKR